MTPARLTLAVALLAAVGLMVLILDGWLDSSISGRDSGISDRSVVAPEAGWPSPPEIEPQPPAAEITETLTRPVFNESRQPVDEIR
ncbi:MAG: hypothetical protein RIE31_04990 [Alphaproteobacteria bacterium]